MVRPRGDQLAAVRRMSPYMVWRFYKKTKKNYPISVSTGFRPVWSNSPGAVVEVMVEDGGRGDGGGGDGGDG